MASTLEQRHIADLHALAGDLGVDRFRMLPREELVAAILKADPDAAERGAGSSGDSSGSEGDRREAGGGRRAKGDRDDGGAKGGKSGDGEPDDPGTPIAGVLDITPRGHGFVRLAGLEAGEDDVYVSPSQIRRCEMERGDEVAGPARSARRGERYPALVHVDKLNGAEPGSERPRLADATPVQPSRRIALAPGADASPTDAVLLRAVDLLAPLAYGQRVLVRAAAASGRTTLLRAIARSLGSVDRLELVVLLVDERPEEVQAWQRAAPEAELAIATAELRSGEQLRLVELALGRATRRAEAGADVVLLIDSLSRVAVAADDPTRVKPIFGSGRETSEQGIGSLTIIATALADGEDEGGVDRALETTETSLIVLDRDLAASGVVPSIDVAACRVAGEEELRSEGELAAIRSLRAELSALPKDEAAAQLRSRIDASADNGALLDSL